MGILNTSDFYGKGPGAYLILAEGMTNHGDPSRAIEEMEANGQAQLVNSDRLPTAARPNDAAFLAVGFTLGDPDPSDVLFRPATLPAGWRRRRTDHSMWSEIVDELGRKRAAIFYKAAFYDRRADMRLETPESYLRDALWHDREPVLDEVWLTREVADATLRDIREGHLSEARKTDDYAADTSRTEENRAALRQYAADDRASADKAEALRLRIVDGA